MHLKRCRRRKRRRLRDSDENNSKSYFENLSGEIVIEILIRLPRQDAVRCKAVCRRWRALTSDGDYFIGQYIKHHQLNQARRPFSLLFQTKFSNFALPERESYSLAQIISDNESVRKLYPDGIIDMGFIRRLPSRKVPALPVQFQLEACCGDWLLCFLAHPSRAQAIYHLCNIETRQWVSLPPIYWGSWATTVGFIQSEFNNYDYRVVRIPGHRLDHSWIHSKLKVDIFSPSKGRWTKSVVSFPRELNRDAFFFMTRMVACKRMLHLLTRRFVIVFDAFSDSHEQVSRIIDLPPLIVDLKYMSSHCFGASQGKIRLAVISNQDLCVWELEDYETGKWCTLYKILIANIVFQGSKSWSSSSFDLLAFHPDNRNIVYLRIDKHIAQCDMEKGNEFYELYKLKSIGHMNFETTSWAKTFPLVHSWWSTPLTSSR